MKSKTVAEVAGKLYWIQLQHLETSGRWQVLPVGEPVLGYLKEEFLIEPASVAWPVITADKGGLATVIQEYGYELEHRGNSAFECHNHYVVKKPSPETIEFSAPLLIVGALRGRQKEALGLEKKLYFHDRFIVETGEDYTGQIVSEHEFQEAAEVVELADQEWKHRLQEYFKDLFFKNSQDFGLSAVMDVGGETGFELEDVPSHFLELGRRLLYYSRDSRQNLSSTYQLVLLNTSRTQDHSIIYIKIPKEFRGLVIGKDGVNIKAISKKLHCTISLKELPHTKNNLA